MFSAHRARRYHVRLLTTTEDLVRRAEGSTTGRPDRITWQQVKALAFARHLIRLDEAEAGDYLAGALVSRGHSIDHLSPAAVSTESTAATA